MDQNEIKSISLDGEGPNSSNYAFHLGFLWVEIRGLIIL